MRMYDLQNQHTLMLQKYRLSINNLALFNSNYPFDFFFRIKDIRTQNYQDSPVIFAHALECDDQFPWEFELNTSAIMIQFVEKSSKTETEIIKARYSVEEWNNGEEEQIIMLSNRTSKKLCILNFTLKQLDHSQGNSIRQTDREVESQIKNSRPQKQKIGDKNQGAVFTKEDQQKLQKQIAQINDSISKIVENEKSEHALFSKYVEQSTSFMREMKNEAKAKQLSNRSFKEDPSEDVIDSLTSLSEKPKEQEQNQSGKSITSKQWYEQKYAKPYPKILKNKNYRTASKNCDKPSDSDISLEYSKEESINEKTMIMNNISFNSAVPPSEVSISRLQAKEPIVKVRSSGGYSWGKQVQLPEMLIFLIDIKDEDRKNKLTGCISKQQMKEERAILFDEKGDQKGLMKFKLKKVGRCVVQTDDVLGQGEEDQIAQKRKSRQSLMQSKEESFEKQSEKQEQKISSISYLNKSEQIDAKIKSQEKPMRGSKISEQKNQKKSRMLIPSTLKKCSLVSNSIQFSFLPNSGRKINNSLRHKREPFLSDIDSQLVTNQEKSSLSHRMINLKIDTINAQLSDDFDQFAGKFIKISMKNKQPYMTETINLSRNLKWKGNGFIFSGISQFSQLKIELYSTKEDQHVIEGTATVCLALLFLDKPNTLQFYHEFLRDEEENIVGQLILGYESIEKASRSLPKRRSSEPAVQQQEECLPHPLARKKKKKNKKFKERTNNHYNNISSQPYIQSQETRGKQTPQSKAPKSIVGSSSVVRTKKYTGGNIIIGRAARFRKQNYSKDPGPGNYEVPSSFERHISYN